MVAVVPHLAAYGLAAADSLVGAGSPLKILSSPARIVVGMLAATVCAVSIAFLPASAFWKPAERPRR
jgi:hypothetical protein